MTYKVCLSDITITWKFGWYIVVSQWPFSNTALDGNTHGANIGPTWVLSAPVGPHVGPTNLVIRGVWAAGSAHTSQTKPVTNNDHLLIATVISNANSYIFRSWSTVQYNPISRHTVHTMGKGGFSDTLHLYLICVKTITRLPQVQWNFPEEYG